MSNKHYETYKKNVQKVKTKAKKTERTFAEQFRLVFWFGMIGAGFIHLISFVSAVAYGGHHLGIMFGSLIVGIIISSVLILMFIEVPKYTFFSVFFENKFDSGINSWGMLGIAAVLFCFSAFLSPSGSGYLTEWFAAEAELVDTDLKQDDFKAERKDIIALWQPKIDQLKEEYNSFFESNKKFYPKEVGKNGKVGRYRLPHAKSLIKKEATYISSIADMEATLNKELSQLSDLKTTVVVDLVSTNKDKKEHHEKEKKEASLVGFVVMVILEAVYILAICGMKYYKHREEKEQGVIVVQIPQKEDSEHRVMTVQTEPTTTKQNSVLKQEPNQTEQGEQAGDTNVSMQFKFSDKTEQNKTNKTKRGLVHGGIIPPEPNQTEPRIAYQNKKGDWSKKTERELRSLARRKQGSETWKKELTAFANKLSNYKK